MTGLALLPVALAWLASADPSPPVVAERPPEPSTVAPPQQREMTRLQLKLRPFLGFGNSWGGIGDARLEHYFRRPFMLGVQVAPLAVAADGQGPGAIAHVRVHAAYAGDYLAMGLGLGGRLQRFGPSGVS